MKKTIFSLAAALLLSVLFFSGTAMASFPKPVEAFDTIVGVDGLVKIQDAYAGQRFTFKLFAPSHQTFGFSGVSLEDGVFRKEISGNLLDESGDYSVSVYSNQNFIGESIFTVYSDEPMNVGGDLGDSVLLSLADASQAAPGGAASFSITNIPASLPANQTASFTLRALDGQGAVYRNYRGTAHFSSPTDENALVPVDYTFQAGDLGEHTFQLSLSFRETGEQKLTAEETGNPQVKGEATINVTVSRQASSSVVRITRPTAGRYGVKVIQIAGEAPPNATVNINDNGQLLGATRATRDGTFSYTSPELIDGEHRLTAESSSVVSDEVVVTIDATASRISEVTLSKNPAGPGDSIQITVKTDPGLENVAVTVADVLVDLQEDPAEPGSYKGQIVAPERNGTYPIDVRTLDSSGNEGAFTEAASLRVDEELSSRISFRVPSRVFNVRAMPGTSRVTLTWSPAQDDTGIRSYRIYYGVDAGNLNRAVNTADARTEWYVPNLQPGVQYFFQIAGVDTDGNEGSQKSETVGAVVLSSGVAPSTEGSFANLANAAENVAGPPSGLSQDGPEVGFLFLLSPLAAFGYRRLRKR